MRTIWIAETSVREPWKCNSAVNSYSSDIFEKKNMFPVKHVAAMYLSNWFLALKHEIRVRKIRPRRVFHKMNELLK